MMVFGPPLRERRRDEQQICSALQTVKLVNETVLCAADRGLVGDGLAHTQTNRVVNNGFP